MDIFPTVEIEKQRKMVGREKKEGHAEMSMYQRQKESPNVLPVASSDPGIFFAGGFHGILLCLS